MSSSNSIAEALARTRAEDGQTLREHFRNSKVLLVFLRHSGCTFCREALSDLQAIYPQLLKANVKLALSHMGPPGDPNHFFAAYNLKDAILISDPQRELFRAFSLQRGRLKQVLGFSVWWRGFLAAIWNRHGFGRIVGDPFQMPGVFLLDHGEVVASFLHQTSADRPDYLQLATTQSADTPSSCDIPADTK